MSAQANIVINDGVAVPVAHTFVPKGARVDPNGKMRALWRENSAVSAEGDLTIVEHFTEQTGPDGIQKLTYVITVPTLETVGTSDNGVTPPARKAYECVGVIEFRFPRRSTLAERGNIHAYVKNFAALAYMETAVEQREPAW